MADFGTLWTAVKIAAAQDLAAVGQFFLVLMYVGRPNILMYEVSRR